MAGRKKTVEKINHNKTEELIKNNSKQIIKDTSKKRFSGVAHKSNRGSADDIISRNTIRKFNVQNALNKNFHKQYKRIFNILF